MDNIILALQGIALTVIPALGYLAWQLVKLHQVRLANQIAREEKEALSHRLNEAVSTAVKSTSQTVVGKRNGEGALPPEVATSAKETARQTAQKLLSPEDLRAVKATYNEEGSVNQLLDPLIEAAIFDTKERAALTAPITTPPKKEETP